MPSPTEIKSLLVNNLWLPLALEGSQIIFPQRKKHKQMKLLTLTDNNYSEIKTFEDEKISKREDVVVWNHSHLQTLRLEVELGTSKIICEGKFDDAVCEDSGVISDELPLDILNLNFFSQNPANTDGRIEHELSSGNAMIALINNIQQKGNIFFYTTLLDQVKLNVQKLLFPLSLLADFSNPASDLKNKMSFIRCALNSSLTNNNYTVVKSNELLLNLDNSTDKIFSIGFVSVRRK